MEIKENIKLLFKKIQNDLNGKRLKLLNKSINQMTINEIRKEIISRIQTDEKAGTRLEDLINEYIRYVKDEQEKSNLVVDGIINSKSDNLKNDLIDKFADQLDASLVYGYKSWFSKKIYKRQTDDKNVQKESKSKNFKNRINRIMYKLSGKKEEPEDAFQKFQEMMKSVHTFDKQNEEFQKQAYEKIFLRKIEDIDFSKMEYKEIPSDVAMNIYSKMPATYKKDFLESYLVENTNLSQEQVDTLYQALERDFPNNTYAFRILEKTQKRNNYIFRKEPTYTVADYKRFYRKHGDFSLYLLHGIKSEDFFKELNLTTGQQVVEELEYFSPGFERVHFLHEVLKILPPEEVDYIYNSENTPREVKLELIKLKTIELKTPEQSLDFFKTLPDDEKVEVIYYFLRSNLDEYPTYSQDLLDTIEDEKVKNTYKIQMAIKDNNPDKALELIQNGEYVKGKVHFDPSLFLELPDEKILDIFLKTDDEDLRTFLIRLSRREEESINFFSEDYLEKREQLRQRNKNIPKSVVVNEKTYGTVLQNVQTKTEAMALLTSFGEYVQNIPMEQRLEIAKQILDKNLLNNKEYIFNFVFNGFERDLNGEEKKLTLKEYVNCCKQLTEMGIPSSECITRFHKVRLNENMEAEELKENFREILKIQDIGLKDQLYDRIKMRYTYQKFEDGVSLEERFDKIYEELLDDETLDIPSKYFVMSKYLENSIQILNQTYLLKNNPQQYVEYLLEKQKRADELNTKANKEKYSEIFSLEPEFETYLSPFTKEEEIYNKTEIHNIAQCYKYLANDETYNKMVTLFEENKGIKNGINPMLLDEKVISSLDVDIMDFISRYGVNGQEFKKVFEDEGRAKIFVDTCQRLKQNLAFPGDEPVQIARCLNNLNEIDIEDIDFTDENNLDLLINISLNPEFSARLDKIDMFNPNDNSDKTNRFERFVEQQKQLAREKVHGELATRASVIDGLTTRFFNIPYKEAKDIVYKFSEDIEELEKKTNSSQDEVKALKTLKSLKQILEIEDKKIIAELFDKMEQDPRFEEIDFSISNGLKGNLKRMYARDMIENCYQLDDRDNIAEVDGIEVYSPEEFNIFVHVVAAFGDFDIIDEENAEVSAKEKWEHKENKRNHILCTSYINNSNLCYAKTCEGEENTVMFGFANIGENSLVMSAPYDLGSISNTIESDLSYFRSKFRSSESMGKYTRGGHNEVCVERRLEENKQKNISPDYVVCFDDINEASKKVAKDFEIPIVYLNTDEIAMREKDKLNEKIEEFFETKDENILPEILNKYQSNVNGLYGKQNNLVERYFNPKEMNGVFSEMFRTIEKEYKQGDKQKAIRCYEQIGQAFQKEQEINRRMLVDAEFSTDYGFRFRDFYNLSQERVKEKVQCESNKQDEVKEEKKIELNYNEYTNQKEQKEHTEREL